MTERWFLGIDENGLGPRLGPLVVTAVAASVRDGGERVLDRKPRGRLAERLGDSKALLAHGNVSLGEAWARAVAARMGVDTRDPDALFRALALDQPSALHELCPKDVFPQCWSTQGEHFEASEDQVSTVRSDLQDLDAKGVDIRLARVSVVCTRRINEGLDAGQSRFDLDLYAMERLTLSLADRSKGDIQAVCGKVGGYTRYGAAFGPLGGRLHAVLEEGAARSAYRFPGVGTMAFVRDADASHLLVALASMIGKWTRELLMARIVRHYGDEGAGHDASGYYDPVTNRFVLATAKVRRERAIPNDCFERRSSGNTTATTAIRNGRRPRH